MITQNSGNLTQREKSEFRPTDNFPLLSIEKDEFIVYLCQFKKYQFNNL